MKTKQLTMTSNLKRKPSTLFSQINKVLLSKKDDLGNLNELASLDNRFKYLWLQDKLGKQKFHEDMRRVSEAVTDTVKEVCKKFKKNMKEAREESNKTITDLKEKFLKLLTDKFIIASYLATPLFIQFKSDSKSQLVKHKDQDSHILSDLLINTNKPAKIYSSFIKTPRYKQNLSFER